MLVGHYVQESGVDLYYHDEQLGLKVPADVTQAVYLMAHDPEITYGAQLEHVKTFVNEQSGRSKESSGVLIAKQDGSGPKINSGSVVVCPWRKFPKADGVTVIHYGGR